MADEILEALDFETPTVPEHDPVDPGEVDFDFDSDEPVEPDDESSDEEAKYAGTFKSVEELEKGYAEAQRLIGRMGQEKGDLANQIAELRGMVQAISGQAKDEPESDGQPWYAQVDNDRFQEAFSENPVRMLDAVVRKVLQEAGFEDLKAATQGHDLDNRARAASDRSAVWLAEHNIPKPMVDEMQRLYETDPDFWGDRILHEDDAIATRGLEQLAKLAKAQVGNGTRRAATDAKRAAGTAPAGSGQSRGSGTPKDLAAQVVSEILQAEAASRKDPLMT